MAIKRSRDASPTEANPAPSKILRGLAEISEHASSDHDKSPDLSQQTSATHSVASVDNLDEAAAPTDPAHIYGQVAG